MGSIAAISRAKFRIAWHTVGSVRHESKLKVAVVGVSAVLLWYGAFQLFYQGMRWLDRNYSDAVGIEGFSVAQLVMTRLLAVFALTLFFMLIFSNVLIVFSTIYRAKEIPYLVQSPMSSRDLFLSRFFECVSISSWASAYLGSPLIIAYGLVSGNAIPLVLMAVVFYVPFVTVPAAIGAIITMVLVRVFPRLRAGSLIALTIVALGGLFLFFRGKFNEERLAEDPLIERVLDAATATQSPLLPSYWASQGVLAGGAGVWAEAGFYFLCLLSTALFTLWLASVIASAIFYDGWSYLMGQDRQRIRPMGRGIFGVAERLSGFVANPHRSLIIKDIKLFWRDPAQWSQFVIFFGLMALYIANLRPNTMAMSSEIWRNFVICVNMAACSLILATLTSRFVFPLVSLEGRRFWILGLAPINFEQIVWQKFWLSMVTTSLFTVGLSVLSCIKLQLAPIPFALSVYSVVVTNFALSGLAVGLGSVYPNFQEDNPARIVSGMGGTLNFLASMAYIVVIVGTVSVVLQGRAVGWFAGEREYIVALVLAVVLVTVLSLVTWILPLRLGLQNLRRSEY